MIDMGRGRPSDKPRSHFGQRLKHAREKAGLTQAELGTRLGVSQRAVAHWERTSAVVRPEQLEAIADTLKISIDELVRETAKKQRQRSGPTGRVQQVFEDVSKLPRKQQLKVVEFVEAFVEKKAAL